VDDLRSSYEFENLEQLLGIYFAACGVLVTERDFYDLTRAYFARAVRDGVSHAEIFFGPQSFTGRLTMPELMDSILAAIDDARRECGISAGLLISAHRHRDEADALELLRSLQPWSDRIAGIGLGGPEVGNPPSKFVNYFRVARRLGFRTTVHAGEEGPASYVREALELLATDRIDHGVRCASDPALVRALAERQVPLTVCPLSNLRLKGVASMTDHPIKDLMDAGVLVTVNSDDPPYFGGYVTENLLACQRAFDLSEADIANLARNGFRAAFIPTDSTTKFIAAIDSYVADHGRQSQNN
jgi:adenosine deaminase